MFARWRYNGSTLDRSLLMLALAAASGCDMVLGLDRIVAHDAAPDAGATCAAIGAGVPRFAATTTTLSATCDHYVTSPDSETAMAWCFGGSTMSRVEQGPIDGALAAGVLPMTAGIDYQMPRIFPEGSDLYVRVYDTRVMTMPSYYFEHFTRTGSGPWSDAGAIGFPFLMVPSDQLSVPTRGGDRRLIYTTNCGTTCTFHELAFGAAWAALPAGAGVYTATTFGLSRIRNANLTADGLRLIFTGATTPQSPDELYYADRASLEAPFGTAAPVDTIELGVSDAYLTEDCAVLYYATNNQEQVKRAHQ